MKSFIKSLRSKFRFYHECYKDARRFLDSISESKLGSGLGVARIESDVVRQYHVIEKGLSMPEFRPGFGKDVVLGLVRSLRALESHPDAGKCNKGQVDAARSVLKAYRERHDQIGVSVENMLPPGSESLWNDLGSSCGGTRAHQSVSVDAAAGFEAVVMSRASVRSFIPELIPDRQLILESVATAARAPSVCNRQTARVHVLTGDAAQRALSHQTGNRGFGHRIPMVIVVTSDLRFFTGTVERYQGWIDGGMFAMLLLLALHARGLGAVALNWSVNNAKDTALRSDIGIPAHERIIMLIGCGYPEPDCVVPVSRRRSPGEITTWIE
jgi:nitroreductase